MACAAIETYTFPSGHPRQWEDADVVQGILVGDETCFEVLHERYRGRIYGFALKRLRDPAEADDVTQEVFLQIHRCLASYEARSSLLTWMFGIAHNQVCRRFRRKRPRTISIDEPEAMELGREECSPEEQVEASRLLERCSRAAERELSSAQKTVFYMKYAENKSTRAIADELGKSSQAVKISLFRSRRTLTQHTADLGAVFSG